MLLVAFMLASAIIAMWMAYLPAVTGAIWNKVHMFPQQVQQVSSAETINRLHKGDRLTRGYFDDRWSAVTEQITPPPAAHSAEQIPEGCEAAFGGLVKVGNFSTRCIAGVDVASKVAVAAVSQQISAF